MDNLDRETPKKEGITKADVKRHEKKQAFLETLERSAHNISLACKKHNIARQTFYNWCKEDSIFKEACDDVQEGLLDLAESMLHKKVREGNTAELIFLLKTKGKKRGYVERQEFAGVEDAPIIWKETKTYGDTQKESDR
tara:strand:- start:3255 stop:3671 length:417 start_codon:yes stop_codon:yes gene_type:complete